MVGGGLLWLSSPPLFCSSINQLALVGGKVKLVEKLVKNRASLKREASNTAQH